jgi:hypothetical protein
MFRGYNFLGLRISHSTLFLFVLVFQAILAFIDFSSFTKLKEFAVWMGAYFGLVQNLLQLNKVNLAIYISITILFSPLMIFCSYKLVKDHDKESRAYLFISPSDDEHVSKKLLHTLLLFLIAFFFSWYLMDFGSFGFIANNLGAPTALKKYHLILAGGIMTWIGWVMFYLTLFSIIWGCVVLFVEEWLIQLIGKDKK